MAFEPQMYGQMKRLLRLTPRNPEILSNEILSILDLFLITYLTASQTAAF